MGGGGRHGGGRAESIPEARLARTKTQWWEYLVGGMGAVLGKWELGKSPREARQGLLDRGDVPVDPGEPEPELRRERMCAGQQPHGSRSSSPLKTLLKHFS